MEKQGSTPLQNAVTSNQREPSVVPTGEFNFVPVEDMFDGPETELADLLANDPGALAQVDLYKADIDRFGIPAMASLGVARPSLATGTFDPVKQQSPASGTYNTMSQILKADSKGAASDVVDPRFASIRQSNFLRYYEHPDFAELGFTPYANMESYYNANSTIWDDMSRMRGEFGSLVGSGFSSVYRSMGDLFDDDAYFYAPDIDSGMEFEDAMAIGNSSRGGALAFTNNLLLNSGYTFGIIGSIAVEELILAGATYLSGGSTSGLAAVRTAQNIGRLGKGAKNFFNISKMQASTRALMNQLKNFDAAKAFWAASKSGGKMISNVLTPQTFSALKNFKTAKNATQNANNLAKAKAGFGGFYRDFRSLNLALAESKLEGGMVYNELIREGVAIQKKKTGNVTPEQMALIQNQAGEGAFYTTMTNAPLIFLSNQFVLGNAMGGFNRSLGRVFNDTFKKGLNGRLFKGKGVKDAVTGKIIDVFEDAGSGIGGWWTKVKAGGVKGGTGRAISATARYFSQNLAEGLQEIGQEAIAVGTKGYYTAVMEDPTAGGIQLQNDMILAGMGSQFSGQGVETFLSGFLMGGIVQGPQKLVFQGMPALYNKISDPAAYKEYQENKKQYVADLVKVHNEAWNAQSVDAGGVFDINQLSFMVQKQVAAGMKANVFSQDRFGFQDEKDFGKFQQMYTMFETGTSGYFRNQLQDFLQMDDNELGQAFPDQKSQIKSGKARIRIQDMINEIDKQESFYAENKDKYPNPFDRTQYEKGTREYALEALKEKAHEHARYLYLFTNDGFKRAVERADSIYTSLAQDPLFDKMAANDVTVLLDKDSISNEIGLLLQDIAVQDKDTKEGKEIIKNKSEKLKKLNAFLQVVTDKNNLTKDGSFDRRKINKLTGVFQDYIAFMAKSTNSFTNKDQIKETLKKMVDYYALKGRARVYDKSIEYLNNPARFSEIVDRQLQVNKDIYKNLSKIHKAQIEKYINIKEANMLMNKLFEAGYVGDPEQVKKFLLTGNVNELKTFYDEQGDIDPRIDKVKYDQIQRLLNVYREMSSKDDTSETTEEKGKDIEAQETKSNQDEILEGAGVDVILPESNNTPLLRTLLDRQYRKYSATQTVLGETVKTFEQWRNEEGLEWQNSFNALKKLWVSNSIPTLDAQGNPIFGKLSEKDIASETGFDEWLRTREVLENPLVKEVLDAAGIPLNEMYFTELTETDPTDLKAVASEDDDDIDPANPPAPKVFQPGATADVLKIITINGEGNVEALFKLVDKLGNNISQELLTQIGINLNAFSDSGSAIAAMRELDKRAPDSTPFPFDGQMLFQGQLVYDNKEGKEYRVLTTPKFVQGGTLRLLPNNFEGKPISLQSGQFKNKFSTQELKFDLLPTNVARVNVNAINQMYPHVNSVNGKRDYTTGQDDRLNVILDNLTEEEMLNLELVISIDSDRGNDALQFTLKGKETNPYIKIQQSKYKIGLRISNKDTKNKIDSILKERNIPQTDSENGVFAYIPNGIFNMIDPQGNPVDLSNMSREQALNTIFVPKSVRSKLDQKQTLELVRDNFAINQLLLNYADGVMGDNNQLHFATLNTLPFGLNFIAQKGGMSYDNNTVRSLKDLRYDSVDDAGNYFVFDLKKTKGGRTVQFVTTADEGSKLSKKIRENLQEQQLWDDMMAGTDRYYAMVLLPDGNYRAVNLKARELTKGERDDIYVKLVDRAQKTKKENLDKGGKEKDLGFNSIFNEELTDQLFISSKEGFSVSLQVTPWGKLQLQLYNRNTKRQVGKTIDVDIPSANDLTFVDGKGTAINEYVDTLIKDFNNDPDIKAAKVSITNKNLRQSFPSQTSSDIIINSTTTNVTPDVIFNSTGRATAHSSAIQSLKGVQQSETVDVEEVSTEKVEPNSLTAEEAEFSILDVSEDVFAEYAAGDFVNVPLEFIDHIVNKIVTQGEAGLSSREQEILSKRGDTINIKVSRKLEGAPIPTTQGVFTQTENFTDAEGNPIPTGPELKTEQKSTNPLDKVKQKLESLKAQILEGVAPRDKSKTLRGNEEYQKLLAERKAIEKEANKILSASELTSQDVEDIDVFTKWASENLPSYISIADIDTLGNNLKDGGVRVGAFVLGLNHIAGGQNVSGTIYTGANSPFKYHEAFHGIYRMLLTDEEINNYRSIARKEVRAKLRAEGKNLKQELERFRNSADTYTNMTETELQNEYYEEYLADEFEKFKISPKNTNTDAAVKSLFTRILEWIQAVFSSYNKNELQTLFENIDAGKFKGAQIANNQFTTSLDVGATIEANALIPYDSEFSRDETKLGYIYLDSNIADPLVRSISAMFLQRIGELTESYNSKEQLDLVMDDFIWLYDLENPNNENKTEIQKQKLGDIQSAFENYSTEIKEEVVKFVNQISDKADLEEFAIEEFEDETGLRTTSEYDKDASMIGGFRSLSSQLRGYIATTTVESSDYFGNTELKDGEPLIIAVNFTEAYNGLLKSVKNLTNPKEILQSMYFFGQDNAQAGAVVRRMLNDIGITVEQLIGDNTIPLEIQSPLLMQSILKGFENFRVDYLFNERDNLGNTIVYSASERDDINSQLDRWSQGFISMRQQLLSDPKRKNELIDLLADLQTEIIPTDKSISNTKLRKLSKLYSEELFNLSGIKLSPLYIQYSMLYNRSKLEPNQKAFLNINKNETPLTHDVDGTMFKESSISIFSQIIQSNNDIFDTGEQGMDSRLKTMAISNAPFDETIGASVFKNPNGDLVYAHQLPTYHLKMIAELNKQGRLEELINSDPYLKNNFLLNSAAFKKLSQQSRLQITRVAGNKIGDILSSEEDLNNNLKDVKQTSTYGDFTPQEFAINLINNYAGLLNNKSYKVSTVESLDDEGNKTLSALAPILIRVMEASNTGDLVSLPVIKTVEMVDGQAKLTEEAVDIYIDKIRTEFARINRAAIESTSVQEDIVGYNNEGGRAFKFFNSGTLMSAELQESLINRAIQAGNAGNVITLEDALAGTVTVSPQISEYANKLKLISERKAMATKSDLQNSQLIKDIRVDKTQPNALTPNASDNRLAAIMLYGKGYVTLIEEGLGEKANEAKTLAYRILNDLMFDINEIEEYMDVMTPEYAGVLTTNENPVKEFFENDIFELVDNQSTQQTSEVKSIPMQPDNVSKILSGEKTTTLRTNDLPSGVYNIGGQQFNLTNRGLLSIEEAGGVEAISKSEVFAKSGPKFSTTKNFLAGRRKLYVYDISPTPQTSEVAKEVSGMTALRDNVVDNLENSFTEFEQLIDELQIEDQISNQVKSGPIIAAGVSRNKLVQSASLLNMNDNYRHNLKQIFFNDNINTYSINEILLGDQAVSLKDAVDQVKRAKMQNGAYYSAYSAISAPKFGVIHPVEDISLVALEEPESDGIDIADAQMYMTTKAFRYMWFGFGKLTAAQAELIDRIETLEDITPDSIFGNEQNPQGYAQTQSLLNSKKLVYGDGSTFLKMSAFTLTPGYTSTWNSDLKMWLAKPGMETLHNLRVKLEAIEKEKETIAIAAPLSAIKMKKQRVNSLEELQDTKPFTNGYTTLDARFMGLQQLNPSNKLEQVDPTQIKQILTSEQDDSQFVPALNMDIGQIKEAYNNAISQRVSIKFKDKRNLIFTFDGAMDELTLSKEQGKVTPKLAAFLQYALSGLKASQSSSQILEFFSMTDGVQNYNLNNQITVRKFEQLFLTYFSKGVFSERTPGLGLTLVSDFGNKIYRRVFEIEDGVPVRSEVLRRGAFKGDPNDLLNIDSLTQSNIGAEGVIVLDRLRHGVMEYDSNGEPTGQRYTEMMMPAHHLSVAKLIQDSPNDAMPDVISKMFGVRIPSQDNHSAMNIKWVDFMPSYYGSSAMFARELVEISGADFDIDKVFAQFKDFYVKDNEFYEYGNKNSLEENYSDYVRYVNDKVNQSGTIYSEAFLTYDENLDGAKLENSATKLEAEKFYKLLGSLNIITDAGLAEKSLKALQILGLPITEEQYGNYVEKFGEPYAAPLNNKILDYKYALLGNDAVASGENPISYAPATLDILEITLSTLAEESKLFENRMLEDNIDVDNLVGKIKAFKANKGASIGAAVLPNLYLSLLTEYAIDLKTPIYLNKVPYDSFKYTKENKDKSNQRKQDTISSLITMATDNAKERLFSKLGLNKHALGIVTMMTSLSIPIRTSILLINNPIIQDLYSQALNKKDKFDPGIEKLVENKIKELMEVESTNVSLKEWQYVTDEVLLKSIDFPEEIVNEENIIILSKFQELITLGSFTEKMGAPTSLTKGLGKNMAVVMKKKQDIADLLDVDAPLDLNKIYKSDTWNSRYVNLFNELTENLLPEIFLSSSPVFQEILNDVIDNVDSRSSTLQSEDIQNISLDLLSYLNIKGYQYNLLQSGTLNEKTISNELIYPGSNRSIVDVVNNIKTTLESKNETNFFIDNFVTPLSADAVDNYSGLNLAVANTFRNLSALQKIDLQSGFAKLFGSLDTKDDAQTILNYIMVKDGLQVGYQSLLEAIAPFTLNRFLSHINTVEQAVRGDVSFESVFGLSKDELTKEFTEGFLESNINGSKLWTFERSATTGGLRKGVSVADNVVTVNWNAVGLKRDAIPNYVRIKDILGEIKTYKLDTSFKSASRSTYNEIDTYGSNQQTHIGFMFGPRPTYKEIRNFVKAKNGQTQEDPSDFTALMDDVNAIQEEILKAENVNIEATENSIEVQLDPEANMVNVADTALLLEQLGLNQDAQDQSEMEANVIDNVDTSLPQVDEVEAQLTLDFEIELDEQFPTLTDFWDTNIQGNKKAMANLRENNILSLDDFIEEYNTGIYESEESFLDQIKKCNL